MPRAWPSLPIPSPTCLVWALYLGCCGSTFPGLLLCPRHPPPHPSFIPEPEVFLSRHGPSGCSPRGLSPSARAAGLLNHTVFVIRPQRFASPFRLAGLAPPHSPPSRVPRGLCSPSAGFMLASEPQEEPAPQALPPPMSSFHTHPHPTPDKTNLGASYGSAGQESACNVGDLGMIAGLGRSSGEGKGYQLQYYGLKNPIDCIALGVSKSRTRLSNFHLCLLRAKVVPRP